MNKKTLLGIIPIVVLAALQTAISEIRMDLSIKDAVKEEIANQKSETEGSNNSSLLLVKEKRHV